MRLLIMLVMASLTCVCKAQFKPMYVVVKDDPMKARIYTLDNGLKVYLTVNREAPRVTAHIAVNTGHKNDPAETTGLAHYLEHLMFKGTKQFGTSNYEAERPLLDKITALYEEYRQMTDPAERRAKYHEIDSISQIAAQYNIPNEYDKLMAGIGGEGSNAYTWFDVTCYTEDVPSNEVENWAKIQSDRFQNMVVRGFHTELEAVYEEKNISLSNDGEKAFDALMAKLFPSHSYGTQTTIGTQDHLKNPSIVNILDYYHRYYVPNNVAICMSGDIDMDKTIAIIDKYFGAWQKGSDPSPRSFPAQPVFTAAQDTTVVGLEQENVTVGWRMKGAADVQNDTLTLVEHVLSNGKAGLIDLNLNQAQQVQDASAGVLKLKDYSVFVLEGTPNQGQSLEEVRQLLLAEVEKVKRGEWDDNLLESIINNMKLRRDKSMESNASRVSMFVDAYINGQQWSSVVGGIERMSHISKQDVMAFASKYLTDGYVCVYKRTGEDLSIKKIDKPEITPIPTNRDKSSAFLNEIVNAEVEPIQPRFVDFDKDMNVGNVNGTLPLYYIKNVDNDLFTLVYKFDFGQKADNRLSVAADYMQLLGTKSMTAEQLKKQFYQLACSYSVRVYEDEMRITLQGINANMPKAVALLEDYIKNVKVDKAVYEKYVEQVLKMREDNKKEQKVCFAYLWEYAMHGAHNSYTDVMSEQQLRQANPKALVDLIRNIFAYEHQVLYYGPSEMKDLAAVVAKAHKVGKRLAPAPEMKDYAWEMTPQTEVIIAPYDAKNIYMRMYHNEGREWSVEEAPVQDLFNEYFGGGMNTIVFQELREARGLAYNANAYYYSPSRLNDPEYVMTHIISQNDKMMDCISVFNQIIDTIPQSEAAFGLAKQSLLKSLACQRITKMGIINSYFAAKKLALDHWLSEDKYRALPGISMEDMVNFEREQMARKPYRYVILGDEKQLDMPSLEKIGPVRRVTLEEIFGY